MKRWCVLGVLLVTTPVWFDGMAAAQSIGAAPDPVDVLPGFGRPIDREATAGRRARVARRIGRGVLAVPAARQQDLEVRVLQDNDFRQNDYFFYLTGLESPDGWLVIAAVPGESVRSALLLPPRDPSRETWTGKKIGPGPEARHHTGIAVVLPVASLDSLLASWRAAAGGPEYAPLDAETLAHPTMQGWSGRESAPRFRDAAPILDSLRMVKDADELERLRRAIAITAEAQRAAMRAIQPGMYEYQVEAIIEYTFRHNGADRVAFPSIVGSGPNSTTLHYDVNRRRIEAGDLVVMDIGAEYGQYSADVTRTVPASGRFSATQRAVYDLVLGAQQAAIDATRPGVTIGQLSRIARRYIAANSGTLCGQSDCNAYFIHGLSHWLGMRVHDVGDYSRALEPGMVFTIEPGIYIPDQALGVRIEDDILVTETGAEILSAGAPRNAEAVEALMRERAPIP